MSVVSGVTLIVSTCEDGLEDGSLLASINAFASSDRTAGRTALSELTNYYGGGKHPQLHAFGAGINYFDEDRFAAFILSLPWEHPENVVLVIQPEAGATRIFRPDFEDHP